MTGHELTCSAYLAAIPWPELLIAGLIGFLLGALLGLLYGRTHPRPPSREQEGRRDV